MRCGFDDMNDIFLPPTETPDTLAPSLSDEKLLKKESHEERVAKLRRQTLPLRMICLSLFSVGIGFFVAWWLLPLCPQDLVRGIFEAHIPRLGGHDVSFALQFLRLCLSCLPVYILLSLAGLTSFCEGLTSALLSYRSICDGFALCAFLFAAKQNQEMLLPCVLYGGFVLARLCLRICLGLSSAHTADGFFDPATRLRDGQKGVSPLLLRHIVCCLLCVAAGMSFCVLYVILMNFWI